MNGLCKSLIVALLAAVAAAFSTTVLPFSSEEFTHETGDYEVHLGVVPADWLTDNPGMLPAAHHPGKGGPDQYHVLVAVFDRETGKRVTDALVEATVEQPSGLDVQRKPMDPTPAQALTTYCNFFHLEKGEHYTIRIRIRRPEESMTASTRFDYAPFAK